MAVWDPDQYLRFSDERLQPAIDLLTRIPLAAPRQIFDLGCGAGNVTRLLRDRWPEAIITGVDGSAAMIDRYSRPNTRDACVSPTRCWPVALRCFRSGACS